MVIVLLGDESDLPDVFGNDHDPGWYTHLSWT
jgi:hypothetical protein